MAASCVSVYVGADFPHEADNNSGGDDGEEDGNEGFHLLMLDFLRIFGTGLQSAKRSAVQAEKRSKKKWEMPYKWPRSGQVKRMPPATTKEFKLHKMLDVNVLHQTCLEGFEPPTF